MQGGLSAALSLYLNRTPAKLGVPPATHFRLTAPPRSGILIIVGQDEVYLDFMSYVVRRLPQRQAVLAWVTMPGRTARARHRLLCSKRY
jgi:hypothetical protein